MRYPAIVLALALVTPACSAAQTALGALGPKPASVAVTTIVQPAPAPAPPPLPRSPRVEGGHPSATLGATVAGGVLGAAVGFAGAHLVGAGARDVADATVIGAAAGAALGYLHRR